ncbi:MAG TPA: hypothetical protein VF747_07920 [Blastocatellia bacterium]|jgi:hypothetical protein
MPKLFEDAKRKKRKMIRLIMLVLIPVLLAPFPAAGDSNGPRAPATVTQELNGTVAWQSINNAKVEDGFYATATQNNSPAVASHTLILSNFGFSLPAGAVINGVVVEIRRAANSTVKDLGLVLFTGTESSEDRADTSTLWPVSFSYRTYGTPSDAWGLTLTPELINSSSFSVRFAVVVSNGNVFDPAEARLDNVRVTVHYTPGAPPPPDPRKRKRSPIVSVHHSQTNEGFSIHMGS